ncbi:MAG TPA: hypothetical protein VE775_10420, partial [Pyrinomonadaceae bacterium]|nr:hypothetical protein [Pyrinomonadaceae bacterium]
MTNDEMQNIIDFMIQRQEIFSANMERLEANQERLGVNLERVQVNQERTQAQVDGLATAVGHVIEVQARVQDDISHLVKIVTTLVERERNGRNSKRDDQNG